MKQVNNISRKAATFWNFLFLNVKFIVSLINGVLIIPLYLYYIDSGLYGSWLATGNVLVWISIVDPGVGGVLLQKIGFARGKNDNSEVGRAVVSGALISLVIFVFCVLIGYLVSFYVIEIARIKSVYQQSILEAFRIAVWGTAFGLFSNTFTNVILAYQKTKLHGITTNIITVLGIILNIALLISGFGLKALAIASLFTGLLTFLYSIIVSFILIRENDVRLTFEATYLRSFSGIFAYTFFSRLFETISSNIDLILVSRYLGPNFVTALDLSRRPIRIMSGLANNVTISMLPTLSHLFGSNEMKKIGEVSLRVWSAVSWISTFIVGGFILFNQSLVTNWVGVDHWIGNGNNILLCFSYLLSSVGYNLSNITYSMGDIQNNSLLNIVRGSVYIILLYILGENYGVTGVLVAFLVSVFTMILYYPRKVLKGAMFSQAQKLSVMKESFVSLAIVFLTGITAFFFPLQLDWYWLVGGSVMYAVIYCSAIYVTSASLRRDISIYLKQRISNYVEN